jgi:PAS domain-containing protein
MDEVMAALLELKARFEELAGKHRHYFEFFERAPQAYLITDTAGCIQEANGAAVDVLQRRKRDLRARPFAALVALDQRSIFRSKLRALAAREPGAERSWRTIVVAPELRIEVKLTTRLIEGPQRPCGIAWLLEPQP